MFGFNPGEQTTIGARRIAAWPTLAGLSLVAGLILSTRLAAALPAPAFKTIELRGVGQGQIRAKNADGKECLLAKHLAPRTGDPHLLIDVAAVPAWALRTWTGQVGRLTWGENLQWINLLN